MLAAAITDSVPMPLLEHLTPLMAESGQPQLRLLRGAKGGWVDVNPEHFDLVKCTTLVVRTPIQLEIPLIDMTMVLSETSSTPLALTSVFHQRPTRLGS